MTQPLIHGNQIDGSTLTLVDAATLGGQPIGVTANDILALNGSSQIPAVDGSLLTGIDGTQLTGVVLSTDASQPKVKILDIGDWDMDATLSVNITHGVSPASNIRSVSVSVRSDTGLAVHYDLLEGGEWFWAEGNAYITLQRDAAGIFDNNSYDETSYNRGFVTIHYV